MAPLDSTPPGSSPNGMPLPQGSAPDGDTDAGSPTPDGPNDTGNGPPGSRSVEMDAEALDWDASPFDLSAAPKGRFAMETRAETTRVVTGGDATRRGEIDQLITGGLESFVDGVLGEENTTLNGTLLERTGRGSKTLANKLELTVGGRMSLSAKSWQGAGLNGGEDAIILGGALTDTWTGGLMIASAMSDDLVIGAGVRLTVPMDIWLNQLTGMEERPGTAAADALMIDMCGTLFEREYGAGMHAAGIALLSGTVYQTQRVGFRPMMRAAMGVRNLIPGSGAPASEQPPPSPPAAPGAGAEGVLVATSVGSSAAGSVRHFGNFQDAGRVAGSADEMANAADLRHADNTAGTLEDASTAARNLGGSDAPNGMANPGMVDEGRTPNPWGTANPPRESLPMDDWVSPMSELDLQRAQLPEGFDTEELLSRLDHMTAAWLRQIEWGRNEQIGAVDSQIAVRVNALSDLGRHAGEFEVTPLPVKPGRREVVHIPSLGDAPVVRWTGTVPKGADARVVHFEAQMDALMALKGALSEGLDPVQELRSLAAQAEELYGATDPRTLAYADTLTYYDQLARVHRTAAYQNELDVLMLMRSELLSGRNPRVAAESFLEAFETGADAQRAEIVNFLAGSDFDIATRVPEGMDNTNLIQRWQGQAVELRRQAAAMDVSTPAGAERASTLSEAASALENAAFELMVGNDPTNMLLRSIGSIETRTFVDGGNGAFEAGHLRLAWQEYSVQVDLYRQVMMGESSLDVPGFRRVAATPIDPPTYADVFPGGVPEEFRRSLGPPEATDEVSTALRSVPLPRGDVPDEFRQVLDLPGPADEVVTAASPPVATLPSGNPGLLEVYEGPPILAPLQPRMDDVGATWRSGSDGAAAVESATGAMRGNYQTMGGASNVVLDAPVTISDDTQAAVSAMPVQAVPDDFRWSAAMDAIKSEYMDHRRSSNWRGALAYTDAIEGMRNELVAGFADLGGNIDDLPGRDHHEVHKAIQGLLEQANQAGDATQAKRIGDFLESFEQNTYDIFADLVDRADEFESGARGQIQPLDPHIDQAKLLDWLKSQQDDAMRRMGSADEATMTAASHEATYYQQMVAAMERGVSPLSESGDQIAYLRATAPEQADIYSNFHDDLVSTLSNPDFHRSATEMGDDTYAPVALLRPELGNQPLSDDGMQTQLFDAEAVDPDGRGEVSTGDYAANRDRINSNVGDNDFTRAPDERPEGIEHTEPRGRRGILKKPDPDAAPPRVSLDDGRAVNQGPDTETVSDLDMRIWAERLRAEASEQATRSQGGFGNYMDQVASMRPPPTDEEMMANRMSVANPYAYNRVEAANQLWDAQRLRDARPPSEWDRWPSRQGFRSWDQSAQSRRSVRFGDASVVTVYADADDVRRITNQWRDLDAGNAAMPWWTGSGINRPTDAINADEAVRHVPTPRTMDSRRGYPSKWRAGRQPGFGRLADSPGAFPFSPREQLIADLMRGQRVDASHIDLLQDTLNEGVRANRVRHKEWLDMNALLRSLRYGVVLGDSSRPFAQALDWRTLSKMLDMLESAASTL